MTPDAIHQRLLDRFDEAVVAFEAEAAQPWIEVAPDRIDEIARTLRDDDDLAFDRLLLISGIDYEGYDHKGKGKHRPIAKYGEDGKPERVEDPGTAELGVTYHLQSRRHMHEVVLKVRLPREAPRVRSLASVYPTAAWSERETFDFYGIEFEGHPDLRRIFLPEDWEGWPLRKDYEMPSVYNDVPLEGLPLAVRQEQERGE